MNTSGLRAGESTSRTLQTHSPLKRGGRFFPYVAWSFGRIILPPALQGRGWGRVKTYECH